MKPRAMAFQNISAAWRRMERVARVLSTEPANSGFVGFVLCATSRSRLGGKLIEAAGHACLLYNWTFSKLRVGPHCVEQAAREKYVGAASHSDRNYMACKKSTDVRSSGRDIDLSAAEPALDCLPPGQTPAHQAQPSTGGIALAISRSAAKHSETTPRRDFEYLPSSVASSGPRAPRDPRLCKGNNPRAHATQQGPQR